MLYFLDSLFIKFKINKMIFRIIPRLELMDKRTLVKKLGFEALQFFCHYINFGIGRTCIDIYEGIRDKHIFRNDDIKL